MKKIELFGDFTEVVARNGMSPALEHVIVENGLFVGSNATILMSLPVGIYINDPEEVENIEGKAFNTALLTRLKMAKWRIIEFKPDTIILIDKNGNKEVQRYSAVCGKRSKSPYDKVEVTSDKEYRYIDCETGEQSLDSFIYPRWEAVVPSLCDSPEGIFPSAGLDPKNLSRLYKIFPNTVGGVELRFFQDENTGDDINFPSRAIEVMPILPLGYEDYKDKIKCLIMPIILKF